MNIQKAFDILSAFYGSNAKAGRTLGYTEGYFAALKDGRKPMPKRVYNLILNEATRVAPIRYETFEEILLREFPEGIPSTLKPKDLCKILQISKMSLYQRIHNKKMLQPQRKSNKRLFWNTDTLIDFFNSQNYRRPVYVERVE